MINKPFNEKNIETLLKNTKSSKQEIKIPANFTISIMDRIRNDENVSAKHFEEIYKKFLIFGTAAAAAAIIFALNFIFSYNAFSSEYAMLDILSGNIF